MGHTQTGPGDELLTRAEVARLARVSGETVRRWGEQGIGPSPIRLGPRSVRYRLDDVTAWLDQQPARRPDHWRASTPTTPAIPPACGQCDARPDDHPAARWTTDHAGRRVKCPTCHPGALVAS
jgi:predicted DNA-binding transcriptional regulator AlpA